MKFRLFLPFCIGILMLSLSAIGIFSLLGYRLIENNITYLLFGLLIALVLGALAVWITRKVKKNGLRILVGSACSLIVAAVILLMFSFFSFVASFYTPQMYTVLSSESGKKLAVMREFSQDYAYERCRARGGETIVYEDLGYSYQIYPVFSKFFYNSKAPAEGSLEIGCESDAVLMHQWEGESLRMYIDNAAEFDLGELNFR